jgi:hypothetical protein
MTSISRTKKALFSAAWWVVDLCSRWPNQVATQRRNVISHHGTTPVLPWTGTPLACGHADRDCGTNPSVVSQDPPTLHESNPRLHYPVVSVRTVVGARCREPTATYTLLQLAGADRVAGNRRRSARCRVAPAYADGLEGENEDSVDDSLGRTHAWTLRSWRELDYVNGASGTCGPSNANGLSVSSNRQCQPAPFLFHQ